MAVHRPLLATIPLEGAASRLGAPYAAPALRSRGTHPPGHMGPPAVSLYGMPMGGHSPRGVPVSLAEWAPPCGRPRRRRRHLGAVRRKLRAVRRIVVPDFSFHFRSTREDLLADPGSTPMVLPRLLRGPILFGGYTVYDYVLDAEREVLLGRKR